LSVELLLPTSCPRLISRRKPKRWEAFIFAML
jgi:hypothetical protein